MVLKRVGLEHECEANIRNFSPRRHTKMWKLRQSLPNLRTIFQRCKVPEGQHTWQIIISNNKMKICSLSPRKTAILTRYWWEECLMNEFIINIKNANNPRSHFDYFSVLKTLHLKSSNGADAKSLCIWSKLNNYVRWIITYQDGA